MNVEMKLETARPPKAGRRAPSRLFVFRVTSAAPALRGHRRLVAAKPAHRADSSPGRSAPSSEDQAIHSPWSFTLVKGPPLNDLGAEANAFSQSPGPSRNIEAARGLTGRKWR